MVGLGTRSTIERVEIGNSRPKVARASALPDVQRDELLYLQVEVLPAQFPIWRRSHIRQSSG
jgi:hypothetical protein